MRMCTRRDLRITRVVALRWRLGFMTFFEFASFLQVTTVEFVQHHPGEDLNMIGFADVAGAEVVVTTV